MEAGTRPKEAGYESGELIKVMQTGDSHGGIHPIKGTSAELRPGIPHPTFIPSEQRVCFVCMKDDARHFCMENEEYIHARCALKFLQTEEGQIIAKHGHTVHLDFKAEVP